MQSERKGFWQDALTLQGSITPLVIPLVLLFGVMSGVICLSCRMLEQAFETSMGLEVAPYEIAGAALGLMLILRTNAGYDRWWEARKLWGGIVNQSRNLVISGLAYGPTDPVWRESFVRWSAVFSHVSRCSLRGMPPTPEIAELVGQEAADQLAFANHMPSFVAMKLGDLLREGCERHDMDRFYFLQLDKERATLIDHVGACERILKTPLPLVYSIKIRRFIAIFLLTLPFALIHRLSTDLMNPIITMLVAYPLISLDQIGVELQNPFATDRVSHLPLNNICATIEGNLTALLKRTDEMACR